MLVKKLCMYNRNKILKFEWYSILSTKLLPIITKTKRVPYIINIGLKERWLNSIYLF